MNLVRARHEDEDIALGGAGEPLQLIRGHVPDRDILRAVGLGQVLDFHGVGAAFRAEGGAGGEEFLELRGLQRGGHDDQLQIGARRICWRSRARASVISP